MNETVNKDMTLGDVVKQFPAAAGIMMKYGLHCIGCHVSEYETVEQGAQSHGMSNKEIEKMLNDINDTINHKEAI